jgi:hypothetical protein
MKATTKLHVYNFGVLVLDLAFDQPFAPPVVQYSTHSSSWNLYKYTQARSPYLRC